MPLTGLDGITCTCAQAVPSACDGQQIAPKVQRLSTRACRLFAQAVDAPARRERRRLRQGARALQRALNAVVHAQLRGLAPECAAALADHYRQASDRAVLLADTIR